MKRFSALFLCVIICASILTGCGGGSKEPITMETQTIGLTGVGNARELGGYESEYGGRVKRGVFLRTAALDGATEEDIQRLTEVYNLSEIVDLRSEDEAEAKPDPEIEGVKRIRVDILDSSAHEDAMANLTEEDTEGLDLDTKVGRLILSIRLGLATDQMYVEFLSGDIGKEGYGKLFEELLNLPQGEALLFHCSQGKDRTGLAAMLILSALGVDEDTIMEDFLLTNVFNAELIESEKQELMDMGYEGEELEQLMAMSDQVNSQFMRNAIDWMKENYGSVIGYITEELGVTEEQLDTLREMYLVKDNICGR